MKILVTGAAGFIGFYVALRLLQRGDEVVGLDNLNAYYDVGLKEARLERLLVTSARDDAVRAEREYLERLARLMAEDGARAAIAEGLVLIDRVEQAMDAAASAWAAARREVAEDPRFQGCDLPVLPGFVPLGQDPVSKLQEFAYASTGELPVRAASGALTMPEGMAP